MPTEIIYRRRIVRRRDCYWKGTLQSQKFAEESILVYNEYTLVRQVYTGVQRIYPGKASLGRCMGREQGEGIGAGKRGGCLGKGWVQGSVCEGERRVQGRVIDAEGEIGA